MLAIWISCKQSQNYPECLRLSLCGFRFLSSTYCDSCSWFRPSANTEDSRRMPEKTSGIPVSHNIKQPFEKSRNILIWKAVNMKDLIEFHVLFSVGLTITRIILHVRPSVIYLFFIQVPIFLFFVFYVGEHQGQKGVNQLYDKRKNTVFT